MKSLAKKNGNEKFPTAMVPEAKTLQDVLDAWERAGLTPVEVATEDLVQKINIQHDPLKNQVKWTVRKADGIQAIGIMVTALADMIEYFIKDQSRPSFTSGEAKVAIYLTEDRLTVGLNPAYDPIVIKGVVAAALWELIERSRSEDPTKEWLDLFVTDST